MWMRLFTLSMAIIAIAMATVTQNALRAERAIVQKGFIWVPFGKLVEAGRIERPSSFKTTGP